MKGATLAAAGGAFALVLGICLAAGIWAAGRTGQPLYVFAGLLAGLVLSAFSAVRLLLR